MLYFLAMKNILYTLIFALITVYIPLNSSLPNKKIIKEIHLPNGKIPTSADGKSYEEYKNLMDQARLTRPPWTLEQRGDKFTLYRLSITPVSQSSGAGPAPK